MLVMLYSFGRHASPSPAAALQRPRGRGLGACGGGGCGREGRRGIEGGPKRGRNGTTAGRAKRAKGRAPPWLPEGRGRHHEPTRQFAAKRLGGSVNVALHGWPVCREAAWPAVYRSHTERRRREARQPCDRGVSRGRFGTSATKRSAV